MSVTLTSPGPTVGIVGGGQLARMLGEAAAPLGVSIAVLDPTPDCPATPVVSDQIVGGFDDSGGIRELAERADVLTYEIELADPAVLETVKEETGVPVHPTPATLRMIQDKLIQKEALSDAGIPVPDCVGVETTDELRSAGERFGWPVMLKARTGGYDGRGNVPVGSPDEVGEAMATIGGSAMVEKHVPFDREISVIGVKGTEETTTFPLTETIHEAEILRETVTPARTEPAIETEAHEVASAVLDQLDGRGVYGIELFEMDGRVLVNEIAPRPHNSGHWTIEGAHTSQFEQHIRAVLGWPLGPTGRRCPTVCGNLLSEVSSVRPAELSGYEAIFSMPGAHLHWYGKREARPLRKMGHVTHTDPEGEATVDTLIERTRNLRDEVSFK